MIFAALTTYRHMLQRLCNLRYASAQLPLVFGFWSPSCTLCLNLYTLLRKTQHLPKRWPYICCSLVHECLPHHFAGHQISNHMADSVLVISREKAKLTALSIFSHTLNMKMTLEVACCIPIERAEVRHKWSFHLCAYHIRCCPA